MCNHEYEDVRRTEEEEAEIRQKDIDDRDEDLEDWDDLYEIL